jgi:outer membrane cobalamin receptor
LLLFVLAFSLSSLSNPGSLHGHVVDPDSRPVRGAQVLVVCDAAVQSTAETDRDGAFEVSAPPSGSGRCELTVSDEGFSAAPMPVAASPSVASQDLGTIQLKVSAVSESVIVSAAQVDQPLSITPSAVTVITGDQLRARQITNVADALREVPGLSVASNGTAGAVTSVFPRGGESDYSLVLVDGIEANTFGGGFDFAHLSTDDLDHIEIVRGPQSAIYGSNAIGSVVNVVTREGGPVRGSASVEFNPDRVNRTIPASGSAFDESSMTASASGSHGALFWGGGIERYGSAGLDGTRAEDAETVDNDDYTRTGGGIRGGWHGPDDAVLRGEVRFEHDERGIPGAFGSNPIGAFTGIDLVSRERDRRWLGSVGGTLPTFGALHTTALVTWNALSSDFASPFGPSQSTSHRWTARVQTDAHVKSGLDATGGVEVQGERATSTFITDDVFDPIPVTRTMTALFGEARWRASDRVYATGGARLDDIRRGPLAGFSDPTSPRPPFAENTVVSLNPRGAVGWLVRPQAGSSTRVRAAAGTGIRPADAFEIAFTDNPGLKPERSRSVEAGVDQGFAMGRASIEATVFHNTFDDLIVATGPFTGVSRFRTDNISNARAQGLEIGANGRARAAGATFDAQLTYTLLSSEILSVDLSHAAPPPFTVGDPLLRRPRHQWSLDLAATRDRTTIWVRGGGRSRVLDVEPSLGTFGGLFYATGYDVWNAGASWNAGHGLAIFGRIENLAGRRYEEVFGFPAQGRRAVIGIRLTGRADESTRRHDGTKAPGKTQN